MKQIVFCLSSPLISHFLRARALKVPGTNAYLSLSLYVGWLLYFSTLAVFFVLQNTLATLGNPPTLAYLFFDKSQI